MASPMCAFGDPLDVDTGSDDRLSNQVLERHDTGASERSGWKVCETYSVCSDDKENIDDGVWGSTKKSPVIAENKGHFPPSWGQDPHASASFRRLPLTTRALSELDEEVKQANQDEKNEHLYASQELVIGWTCEAERADRATDLQSATGQRTSQTSSQEIALGVRHNTALAVTAVSIRAPQPQSVPELISELGAELGSEIPHYFSSPSSRIRRRLFLQTLNAPSCPDTPVTARPHLPGQFDHHYRSLCQEFPSHTRNLSLTTVSSHNSSTWSPARPAAPAKLSLGRTESLPFLLDLVEPQGNSTESPPTKASTAQNSTLIVGGSQHSRQPRHRSPLRNVQPHAGGNIMSKSNTNVEDKAAAQKTSNNNTENHAAARMSHLHQTPPKLQLPALPRYHPSVYQSPNASAMNSPTRSRPSDARSRGSHNRQVSAAQLQLHQYQREMIAAATMAGMGLQPRDVPKAPSLNPCGSPGPATPLTLEEQDDYLSARAVEGTKAGTGLGSAHSTPPVSPAGGGR